MTLKVAIVGLGGIGNNHARVYKARQDVELVAVCDILHDRADKAAAAYGAKALYSVRELLESGLKLDAVSVCTAGVENGGDHYAPTMELLRAGLPVLGEKPISNDVHKAAEMVALAKAKGIRYGINLNHRFTPAARLAKDWCEQGRLGEINTINMTMWINNRNETSPWFHMRALHPHSIDVMRYFAGDVVKVAAFLKKGARPDGPDGKRVCWSNAQAIMQFKNGIIGQLTGSYDATGPGGSYGLERLEVAGMEARFVLMDACEHLTFCPRFSHETVTYDYVGGMMSFGETFTSRIGRWVEQNIAQVAPEEIDGSGEDALAAQRVIEGCIESWQTGQVVTL